MVDSFQRNLFNRFSVRSYDHAKYTSNEPTVARQARENSTGRARCKVYRAYACVTLLRVRHKATYAPSAGCVSTCMCYEIDCCICAHVQLHTEKSPLRSLLNFFYKLPYPIPRDWEGCRASLNSLWTACHARERVHSGPRGYMNVMSKPPPHDVSENLHVKGSHDGNSQPMYSLLSYIQANWVVNLYWVLTKRRPTQTHFKLKRRRRWKECARSRRVT